VAITTNLEFSRWEEFFPDTMLTAALIDRLTHHAHIMNMYGKGYRLKDARENAGILDDSQSQDQSL
jgi:DNA replication protein DnaC